MPLLQVMIKDTAGTTVAKSMNARIKKPPELDIGKDVGPREWVISCGHLYLFTGGNAGATFDPLLYSCSVGGVAIGGPAGGVAEGTVFKVKRNVDSFTMYTGTDGETAWARQHNKSGEISVILKSTAPQNDALSDLLVADEIPAPI